MSGYPPGHPVRRPLWTETDGGWFAGPYRIEMVAPALWVLTHEDRGAVRVLDSAPCPKILAMRLRPRIHGRVIAMILLLASSLALLVTGTLLDSVPWVVAASLATCFSLLKVSDTLMDPAAAGHPLPV